VLKGLFLREVGVYVGGDVLFQWRKYPALLWLEALRCGAVDGVFISRAGGDNLKGDVVELAVDKPEPLRTLTRDVELDSGEPGQVAADVSVAQLFCR